MVLDTWLVILNGNMERNLRDAGYFANPKQKLPVLNWTSVKINKLTAELDHIPQRKRSSNRSPKKIYSTFHSQSKYQQQQ